MSFNLLNASSITQTSYKSELSKNNTSGVLYPSGNQILKIDNLYIINKSLCQIPVTVSLVIQDTNSPNICYLANDITIDYPDTIEVINKDRPVVLLSGQKIHCIPSHDSALDIHINYGIIS